MEKIYARFLAPSIGKCYLTAQGIKLAYADFDEETTKKLIEQANEWVVVEDYLAKYVNDYGADESGSSTNFFALPKMTSISSPTYSTNEVVGDILVENGKVAGAVIKLKTEGGSAFDNYNYIHYCILLTDGTVLGNPTSSYCYVGEDSDHERTKTYVMIKRNK